MNKERTTQQSTFKYVLRLIKIPTLIALVLTPVRFFLELAGIPESYIFIIGLLWLTLGLAIYWGIKIFNDKNPYLILLFCLAIFSPISRFPVAVLWWIDTKWNIGTHYSLYFNNFTQAAFQQVIYGSLTQIIPGFLLGSVTIAIMKNRKYLTMKSNFTEDE